ncbi:MAG: hypothetical protein IPO66_09160 [Rhodanobacteraceae bacterium]|nr:hypothetical protein [Rhodanobacteraceae bacterium]
MTPDQLPRSNRMPRCATAHSAAASACGRRWLHAGCGGAFGVDDLELDLPAAAVEIIRAYSLIHDDLPAMIDDELGNAKWQADSATSPL